MKVTTDEAQTVVREKLAANSPLEERTRILRDNLMEVLISSVETTYLMMGSDIYWQEKGLARLSIQFTMEKE